MEERRIENLKPSVVSKMKNIIILSNDSRCVTQITRWSKELKDESTIESFSTLEDLDLFFNPVDQENTTKDQIENLQISDEKKQSLFNQILFKQEGISLVIVDQDWIGKDNPISFIQALQEKFSKPIFQKTELPTRYFLLSHETTTAGIESLISPLIDDLILKPLDHQLFLQKLAMALSEKRSSAGEFLYNQVVNAPIYLAKTAVIDAISDFGVGIRSTQKMRDGIVVRIYSKVFGEKQESSLLVKTYKTIDHPSRPGEFLIYHSYFGISSQQLQKIRRAQQGKQKSGPNKRTLSLLEIDVLKRNKKHIAVIAFNDEMRTNIRQALEANYINVVVHNFSSIVAFAKDLGVNTRKTSGTKTPGAAAATAAPAGAATTSAAVTQPTPPAAGVMGPMPAPSPGSVPVPPPGPAPAVATPAESKGVMTATPTSASAPNIASAANVESGTNTSAKPETPPLAFKTGLFTFTINHFDEIVSVQTSWEYFDLNESQLLTDPRKWLKFIHPDDLEEIEEFLNYLKNNERGQNCIRLVGPKDSIHYVRINGQEIKGVIPPQIKIVMTELTGEEGIKTWKAHHPEVNLKSQISQLSAIFIDASGITQTIDSWATQVKGFLETTNMISADKKVAVIVLLPEKASAKLEDLKATFFADVILTPLDRKLLLDKMNLYVAGLCNEFGLMILNYDPIVADVKVGQQVTMEMASEFGIRIKSPKPLRQGVFLRFFSPLFFDENYDGILARSFSAHQDEQNKTEYHNVFSFYGISDMFLKHIRKWIREVHIATKDNNE